MINSFENLKSVVCQKKGLVWDECYKHAQGDAVREFFFKRFEGRFFVGFDDYLIKYEDVVDLYFSYVRADFNTFEEAVLFVRRDLNIPNEVLGV